MSGSSTTCTKCGATIQPATAARNQGLCQPCAEGRIVRRRVTSDVPSLSRHIDSQCIAIEKQSETDEAAVYSFIADIWEPNPDRKGRLRCSGRAIGTLRVAKPSGEITLIKPMPDDTGNVRFHRAAAKINAHWKSNEYPDKTIFASG